MDDFDERQDIAFSYGDQSVDLRVLHKFRKGECLPFSHDAFAAREYLGVCWVSLNGSMKLISASYAEAVEKFEELKSRITKE